MKTTRTTTSATQTGTRTATEISTFRRALREAELTPEEESVLRMRFGIGEEAHASLSFRGQSHDQSRVKLAMMERDFLNDAREIDTPPDVALNKDRLLDKLRQFGDDI